MIFDEQGKRLGQGYQEYPCTSPRAGWIEQDAEQVWDGICAASKAAVAAAALPASAYKSVGLSSQRGTILMLDENKNNLMPSVVWNDGRALRYQEEFGDRLLGVLGGYLIYCGAVENGPHAISIVEKLTGRNLGAGRHGDRA